MSHDRKRNGRSQGGAVAKRNGTASTKANRKTETPTPSRNGTANGGPHRRPDAANGSKRHHVEEEEEVDLDDEDEDDDEEDDDEEDDENDDIEDDEGDNPDDEGDEGSGGQQTDNNKVPADEFVGSMYQHAHGDDQRCIRVPMWAIPLTSSTAELVVLSQFAYWFGLNEKGKLRAKISKQGHWWVYKIYNQLAEETNLTRDQAVRAVRNLKEAGILVSLDDVGKGHKVYYRLDAAKIQKLVETDKKRLVKTRLAKKRASGKVTSKKRASKKQHVAEVADGDE